MIPAPYLARAKWVQMEEEGALSDADLKAYIEAAHKISRGQADQEAAEGTGSCRVRWRANGDHSAC